MLPGFVVKPPSKRKHAAVIAIVVVDPLQLVEAIDVVPALQPRCGGVKVANVVKRKGHRRNHHLESITNRKSAKLRTAKSPLGLFSSADRTCPTQLPFQTLPTGTGAPFIRR